MSEISLAFVLNGSDKADSAFVSAVVAGLVSIVVAVLASVLSYQTKIDEGLRDRRITLYKVLWKKTELLPKWPRRAGVTREQLHHFSEELMKWYFDEGGIFLSSHARESYGRLQQALADILSAHPSGHITDSEYDKVRDLCSELRSQLTKDLLSRRGGRGWF